VATALTNDPVIIRFRQMLDEVYGNRLERVVLFGPRAWGDARPDSDYDVAIFLKSLSDRWTELDRLAALRVNLIVGFHAAQALIFERAGKVAKSHNGAHSESYRTSAS
jgi:predicted nucleotidyltransferase